MFDNLLESSYQDDSNKWSNIWLGEEITQVESIEVNVTHLIWSFDIETRAGTEGDKNTPKPGHGHSSKTT